MQLMGQSMVLLLLCLLAVALPGASGGSGRFWHLTDLHWDPGYNATAAEGRPCPSGGDRAGPAGPWGSYLCDAPWNLLRSAAWAMRDRLARPDFVLWTGGSEYLECRGEGAVGCVSVRLALPVTAEREEESTVSQLAAFFLAAMRYLGDLSHEGTVLLQESEEPPEWRMFSPAGLWTAQHYLDDTPHVPNEQLGEEKVLQIIANLTSLIKETFPGTKVYAAMGNHDFHPKNQFPGKEHRIYNQTAELWRPWLSDASLPLFRAGAFYSEKLPGPGMRGRMVVLNTNLYYDQNDETAGEEDPGGQFQWLEETLTNASRADEMVYIVGHVPPGFFEKKRGKPWFRRGFNERYLGIVQRHHRVIAAQFFGHHHTDSFRMFYNHAGAPINVMFLAPGVTPWKTTLPGVNNGANNPAIRVIDYDQDTLQVLDMVTYYLNLTRANMMGSSQEEEFPVWEEEYRLTEAFQVPDGSARSMQMVLERIVRDPHYLQLYYEFNSARYDLEPCKQECRVDHLCAIREVDFTKYDECVKTNSSASAASSVWLWVFCMFLAFLSPQQVL